MSQSSPSENRPSMFWEIVGDTLVLYVRPGNFDTDFETLMSELPQRRWDRCLAIVKKSPATKPSQRQRFAAQFRGNTVALLSPDRVARGVVTALGWMGLKTKSWSMMDLDKALGWLEITGEQRRLVRNAVRQLAQRARETLGVEDGDS